MRTIVGSALAGAAMLGSAATAQPAGGFKHIVVIVQENRTPDNIFGSNPQFEPGVDIANSGVNSHGKPIKLTAETLASCYDISHKHSAFLKMYDGGKMDGADLETAVKKSHHCTIPSTPQFKYVDNSSGTVQPYFDMATEYGFANRMFETQQGPSYAAHQFIFGGTSAIDATSSTFAAENPRDTNVGVGCPAGAVQRVATVNKSGVEQLPGVFPCFDRPTMADILDKGQVSWTYYINVQPHGEREVSALWDAPSSIKAICIPNRQGKGGQCEGQEYKKHVTSTQAQILTDIAHCSLPAVSWVIPDSADSDHSGVNTGSGPSWVASIVNGVGQRAACSQNDNYWQDTAIIVTWDDWGGWYDHVVPALAKGQPGGWGAGFTYGFRVPLLVVSAYTTAHTVDNTNHDFGSILAFIESNFGIGHIPGIGYADSYADKLAGFFNLKTPRSFSSIPAKMDQAHFLTARRSAEGPDED